MDRQEAEAWCLEGISYMVWVAVALEIERGASGRERSLERLAGAGSQGPFTPRNLDLK